MLPGQLLTMLIENLFIHSESNTRHIDKHQKTKRPNNKSKPQTQNNNNKKAHRTHGLHALVSPVSL